MPCLNIHRRAKVCGRSITDAFTFIALSAVLVMLMIAVGNAADTKAPAAARRPVEQILTELGSTVKAFPNYDWEGRLDPKYKQQMKQVYAGLLQRAVDLITELEAADPRVAAPMRSQKCIFLVELALYDDAGAIKSLTDYSTSAVPADAVLGKAGLLALKWWSSADSATQKQVATEFQALARANPKEDVQVNVALMMARYLAVSDDAAEVLHELVEQDLKGPAALAYQKKPVKLGRPFNLSVKTTNGQTVSISNWKGKVVLIDFWATWCPPCRAALPDLIKLYQENHAKGLEVLGISNDSQLPQLKQFLAATPGMVWPESFNPAGPNGWNAISPKMDVAQIPTTFIIDRQGILRDVEMGFIKKELVQKLLDEAPKTGAPPPDGNSPIVAATQPSPAAIAIAPATATPPPPAPATPPDASADSASEAKANALLSLAKNYAAAKRNDLAQTKLKELLKKYPDSAAAKKGKELLAKLVAQSQDQ